MQNVLLLDGIALMKKRMDKDSAIKDFHIKRGEKKSIRLRDKAGFYHQSDVSQRQLLFEKASSMTQHLHLV